MAERKKPLGFKTPAIEMQERFEKMQVELDTSKTKWAELRKRAKSELDEANQQLQGMLQSQKTNDSVLIMATTRMQFLRIESLVARLGVELAETRKRLANCEKAIDELKRCSK